MAKQVYHVVVRDEKAKILVETDVAGIVRAKETATGQKDGYYYLITRDGSSPRAAYLWRGKWSEITHFRLAQVIRQKEKVSTR